MTAVARDHRVRATADGVHHTVDLSGFGVGLALARSKEATVAPRRANTYGRVGRWNEPLKPLTRAHPLRMCHVALNIAKEGKEEAVAFYTGLLGFRPTDVVEPMGVFMQAPGDDDQHTMLLCHRPDRVSTNHVAYEVPGFDDVVEGG
ncbi:VOC family protein, partial [Streptomyces sp. TRM76130]|nr:VOC family protein [Streptomyces sp. TRM76130]